MVTISANAALQGIALIIFARSLGSSEYAVIVITASVAAVAAEFVGFGSGDVLIRDVSRDRAVHRQAFGHALSLAGLSLLPIAVIATIIARVGLNAEASWPVTFALVTSEIVALRFIFMAEQVAVAHHATHAANAVRIVATLVRFGTVCIAVFLAGIASASEWAPYAAVSAAVAAIWSVLISARRFGAPDFSRRHRAPVRVGALFSAMQAIRAFQYSIDKFAVAILATPAMIGSFGIASRVSQLGTLPTAAVTRITYPMFFARGENGLHAAIAFGRRVAPATLGVAGASSIALAGMAYILPVLLGESFERTKPFLLIMALLPFAAALQNVLGSVLSGADHHGERVWALAAGVVLTVGCVGIGALVAGVTGAVFGYMAGQFFSAAALWMPVAILSRREKAITCVSSEHAS